MLSLLSEVPRSFVSERCISLRQDRLGLTLPALYDATICGTRPGRDGITMAKKAPGKCPKKTLDPKAKEMGTRAIVEVSRELTVGGRVTDQGVAEALGVSWPPIYHLLGHDSEHSWRLVRCLTGPQRLWSCPTVKRAESLKFAQMG